MSQGIVRWLAWGTWTLILALLVFTRHFPRNAVLAVDALVVFGVPRRSSLTGHVS